MHNPAERQQYMQTDWEQFANRLGQRELPRLDGLFDEFAYRIPQPGLRIGDGLIYANLSIPGLSLRYTIDGTEPDISSPLYTSTLAVTGIKQIKIAAFNSRGRSGRSSSLTFDPV